jgi:hypothetical protein
MSFTLNIENHPVHHPKEKKAFHCSRGCKAEMFRAGWEEDEASLHIKGKGHWNFWKLPLFMSLISHMAHFIPHIAQFFPTWPTLPPHDPVYPHMAQFIPTWPSLSPTWPSLSPTWPSSPPHGPVYPPRGPAFPPRAPVHPHMAQFIPTWPGLTLSRNCKWKIRYNRWSQTWSLLLEVCLTKRPDRDFHQTIKIYHHKTFVNDYA